MPKRSDEYMADRRRQITQAAVRCILDQGWLRTTIDDVAAAAGLSKGAVYTHFANKRALLLGLLEANVEMVEARAGIADLPTLRDEVTEGMDELAGADGPRMAMGHLEAQLDGARDPEIRAMLNASYGRMAAIFTGIVRRIRPGLAEREARLHALTILLLMEGLRSYRTVTDEIGLEDTLAILNRQLDLLEG